jgi:phage shock protein A
MSKSNSEIAWEISDKIVADCALMRWQSEGIHDGVESALAAAESSLAKQVLDEISTMAGGTHGGGLVVVSRDAAVERLRELFARLNITIE